MTSQSREPDIGVIREAMALRVKYRTGKQKFMLRAMGVHPQNRGGNYPKGSVVKNLGVKIGDGGFSTEEANHAGVCVEEIPASQRTEDPMNPGSPYETYLEMNRRKTSAVAELCSCFSDHLDVLVGTLSHSHLLLVLLSWVTGATWEFDAPRPWCDSTGKLDLEAVASRENFEQMRDVISNGLEMETLSWKIYKEEPTGCSTISYALNKGNQLALRTTELTAMKVLSGEIALAQSSAVADEMLFESIKAKVRHQLDFLVDEPDFIEMFEYIINLGGTKQTYIPKLLRYLEVYLEESERRLRPQAFQVPNRLGGLKGLDFPRARIALIKRAYRQKPSSGFCPGPETKWLEIPRDKMQAFEDLLHHFHRSCGGILEKWTRPGKWLSWRTSITSAPRSYGRSIRKKSVSGKNYLMPRKSITSS